MDRRLVAGQAGILDNPEVRAKWSGFAWTDANAATAKALALPAVRERFAPQGLEAVGGSPEEFARLYREDYDKYGRLVKELSITVN